MYIYACSITSTPSTVPPLRAEDGYWAAFFDRDTRTSNEEHKSLTSGSPRLLRSENPHLFFASPADCKILAKIGGIYHLLL